MRLHDISVGHTDFLRADRACLDLKTVHNVLTLLISTLNVAVDPGWIAKVRRMHKPRIPVFSKDFGHPGRPQLHLRHQASFRHWWRSS